MFTSPCFDLFKIQPATDPSPLLLSLSGSLFPFRFRRLRDVCGATGFDSPSLMRALVFFSRPIPPIGVCVTDKRTSGSRITCWTLSLLQLPLCALSENTIFRYGTLTPFHTHPPIFPLLRSYDDSTSNPQPSKLRPRPQHPVNPTSFLILIPYEHFSDHL